MNPRDVAAFVDRPWHLVERQKIQARAERYRQGGAEACVAAALVLRQRFQRKVGLSSAGSRREQDLQGHRRLVDRFASIANAFARR